MSATLADTTASSSASSSSSSSSSASLPAADGSLGSSVVTDSSNISSSSSTSSSSTLASSSASSSSSSSSSSSACVRWEWYDSDSHHWKFYDDDACQQIESAYQAKAKELLLSAGAHFSSSQCQYAIDFSKLKQINKKSGFTRSVRRRAVDLNVEKQRETKRLEMEKKLNDAEDEKSSRELMMLEAHLEHISLKNLATDDCCGICMCEFTEEDEDNTQAFKLSKCVGNHFFHKSCLRPWLKEKKTCPVCKMIYGVATGDCPDGIMTISFARDCLLGYEGYGHAIVNFCFSGGTQSATHPHPGQDYEADNRTGYIPMNTQGKKVLKMIELAWERRLIFTIGRSITRNIDGCIVWNGIHFKTAKTGGSAAFGFPDPTYLSRVTEELAAKGIFSNEVQGVIEEEKTADSTANNVTSIPTTTPAAASPMPSVAAATLITKGMTKKERKAAAKAAKATSSSSSSASSLPLSKPLPNGFSITLKDGEVKRSGSSTYGAF